jgi:hypothetical protein
VRKKHPSAPLTVHENKENIRKRSAEKILFRGNHIGSKQYARQGRHALDQSLHTTAISERSRGTTTLHPEKMVIEVGNAGAARVSHF